jgi:hypothetical protein
MPPEMTVLLSFSAQTAEAPLLALDPSFIVFLVIVGASALFNWIQRRGENAQDQDNPPGSAPPPQPRPQSSGAPSERRSSWEEELRRMLEGHLPQPPNRPPPSRSAQSPTPSSPPPPPVIIRETTPAPPRTFSFEPPPVRSAHVFTETVSELPGARTTPAELPAPNLAFEKPKRTAVARAKHAKRSPEVEQTILMFRHPRTARQAVVASLILGPPKALQD